MNAIMTDYCGLVCSFQDTSRPQIIVSEVDLEVLKHQPVITKVGSTVRTLTGNDVTLMCSSVGAPPPRVTWTSGEISPVKNGNLTILTATPANSGVYTCTAENVAGSDVQSTALEIIGKLKKSGAFSPS